MTEKLRVLCIGMPVRDLTFRVDAVPARGSKIRTDDYTELPLPGGHVGVFVGGKSQKLFAPAVAAFLQKHDQAVS